MENQLRFSEKDIAHAMKRLGLPREETVGILAEYDRGLGDVDDVIDRYEDLPEY